jgi:endogenous inhibitor of DNA gyrase (YacG/DUF329 family)
MIDLGQWAEEGYRIPGEKVEKENPDNVIPFPESNHEENREEGD